MISQLHSTLITYLALDINPYDNQASWDPNILTEALVIFLFTQNQDVKLDKTAQIVADARIFPVLLNVYLNTLLI